MSAPPWDDEAPMPDDADAEPDAEGAVVALRAPHRDGPAPGTAFTDLGNAERFAVQHLEDVRFCSTLGGWHRWTGSHWTRDDTLSAQRCGHATARTLYREAADIAAELAQATNEERQAKLSALLRATEAHARKTQSAVGLRAMLSEACAIEPIPIAWEAFDADATTLLLNTPNGTIDLATGTLRPHQREDLITKCTAVAFDPNALAPRFSAFLETILPDAEVRGFMQRWAGYAATGRIFEHVLPVWYGLGANGKSVLAGALRGVLGRYGMVLSAGYFEATAHRGHETEIAQLRGARLAIACETERSADLAEARIKDLTGGGSVRGRFCRKDHFEFAPTAKFVLLTNHKPRIRSTDAGILRRVVLIPFGVTIAKEAQDLSLLTTLLAEEGAGILAWIVDGAREVLARGGCLDAPASIQAATAEYLAAEDVIARFLDEGCTVRPPGDTSVRCQPSHLYAAFAAWCEANGEAVCDQRGFRDRLRAKGYESKPSHGKRWVHGLAPLESDRDADRVPS